MANTLLSAEEYRFDEEPRHIIVSDFSVTLSDNETAEKNQASSLAYAYYKTLALNKVDAFFYSAQTDTVKNRNGLRAIKTDTAVPTEKRLSFELYSVIDANTDISPYVVASMKKDSDFNKIYEENRAAAAVKKYSIGTVSVKKFSDGTDPTSSYNHNTLFDFTSDEYDGITAFGAELDTKDQLKATLGNPNMASVGHISVKNIKKSKISNDSLLVTATLGGGACDSYTVTLTLIQQNSKNGDAVYKSSVSGISGASGVLLDFDISEFRRELSSGKLELQLSAYCEDNENPGCELSVERILIGKAKSNAGLILLLSVLAVTALTMTVVLSVIWFRRNYKIERAPKNPESEKKTSKNAEKSTINKKNNT